VNYMPWAMTDCNGQRKYLSISEVNAFLHAAQSFDTLIYSFCWFLAATGCRISEALSIGGQNIDFENRMVIIKCLKKREKTIFRHVPLPEDLAESLQLWRDRGNLGEERFWPFVRMTGYRRICEVMQKAGIEGPHASPKGLRHAFGVKAIQSGVPLNLVQRWLGHADMKTTAIYANAMGPEERELAERMWQHSEPRAEPKYVPVTRQVHRSTTIPIPYSEAETLSGKGITIAWPNISKGESVTITLEIN
jgi:integrase/recombinase XerD